MQCHAVTITEWSCCKSTQLTLWLAKVRKEVVNRRAAVSKYQSCAKRLGGFPGGMKKAVAGMRAAGRSEEAIAEMVAAKTTKLQEFKELEVELRAVRDADPVYQDFVFVKQALADLAADVRCDLCCAYLRLLHSHSRCGLPGRLRSLGGTSRWRRAMHQGTVKPDS